MHWLNSAFVLQTPDDCEGEEAETGMFPVGRGRGALNRRVPCVSVVMAVHNGERFVEEAIRSVLTQSLNDIEFVVVDDGSRDRTPQILQKIARTDRRMAVHTNTVNVGLAASLNKALDVSRGLYIARMDADDVCHPDRLAKQVAFMSARPELVACGTSALIIGEDGTIRSDRYLGRSPVQYALYGLFSGAMLHPSALIRADAVRKGGVRYDANLRVAQDVDFFFRLQEHGRLAILPDRLLKYREHANASSRAEREQQQATHRLLLESRLQSHPLLQALSPRYRELLVHSLIYEEQRLSFSEAMDLISIIRGLARQLELELELEREQEGRWRFSFADGVDVAAYKLCKKLAIRKQRPSARIFRSVIVLQRFIMVAPAIAAGFARQRATYTEW